MVQGCSCVQVHVLNVAIERYLRFLKRAFIREAWNRARFQETRSEPPLTIIGCPSGARRVRWAPRERERAFIATVENQPYTPALIREMVVATMMVVVVGDGGSGGGKYGTPGAGVIIYLAPEIGPADTAGRFNGRTMLELTKTKTKHQLGDFFFHFSSARPPSLSLFLSSSLSLSLSLCPLCSPRLRRRRGVKVRICVVYLCHPWPASSCTAAEECIPYIVSRGSGEVARFKPHTRPLAPR